ncbi:hypothetical protein Pd630_LPD03410 [Rhodococcus opacus PD630]|nr:hypothetical protein Pd630_LPD03410 [Rhodococcus opacus PD630]
MCSFERVIERPERSDADRVGSGYDNGSDNGYEQRRYR